MKFSSTAKSKTFTPEFNGNKDLPESEQIKVEIFRPTLAEMDKIHNRRAEDEVWSAYVRTCARTIKNLEEDEKPIDTGAKLMLSTNKDLIGLMYEIGNECIQFSRLDDKKKD